MNTVQFTHRGWFWFCPIYWAEDGADGCVVDVRSPWQEPLFYVCEGLEALRISLSCMIWAARIPGAFIFFPSGGTCRPHCATMG